ncbi:MAG: cation diffusion facilitator family transporter [Defluviicoccus sp.]
MRLDAAPVAGPDRTRRLKRWAAIAAVAVAALLIAGKAAAWGATGAVSLLSSLVDSLIDLAASTVNLLAIHHAAQPADNEHRFGHGKAEALAGLSQGIFVTGSAAFLLVEAVRRLIEPQPIANTDVGIAVMAVSIVLTLGLVVFQRFVIRRTGSVAISGDALHYRGDLLVNLSVIVALVLSAQFGWVMADPVFAFFIAAYIVWGAYGILKGSMATLMDRELDEADRQKICAIALSRPGVFDVHDVRTRSSGTHAFIQLHLEMDGELTLRAAHAIADAVMHDIERAFPNAEVLIHEDPHGIDEQRAVFS